MTAGFLVTVASGLGCRTYTDMSKASQYIELLTRIGENSVVTIRHGSEIEERAVVHGVSRSDLATERVEVGVVEDSGVAPILICRMLRFEAAMDEDFMDVLNKPAVVVICAFGRCGGFGIFCG